MKYVSCFFLAAGLLVAATVNAKCSSISTTDRFSEAEAVVLVEVVSARDGPVPYPYDLGEGSVPGKLLTLRVAKSWKGSLRPDDIINGWTLARQFEHAYPSTDQGTKIVAFFRKASQHEILCCNSSYPERLNKISEELDSITHKTHLKVDPNKGVEGTVLTHRSAHRDRAKAPALWRIPLYAVLVCMNPNNRFERSRGRVFVVPKSESMVGINQLRLSSAQPRVGTRRLEATSSY